MPSLQAGPLGAILDPLLLVQENGLIVDCNAAAERFIGADRQQIIGRNLGDYSSEQGKSSTAYTTALHNIQQALATGSQRGEWEHKWGGVTFALFSVLYVGLAIAVVFLLWRQILKTGVTPVPLGVTSELPLPSPLTGGFPAPKS